jgi:hypothetical protein
MDSSPSHGPVRIEPAPLQPTRLATMNHRSLRRGLVLSLVGMLLLPIMLAVTLGTAALLAAVGDAAAAVACRWVAMALGILWAVTIVATATGAGLGALTRHDDRWRRRYRRRRKRGLQDRRAGGSRWHRPDAEPPI